MRKIISSLFLLVFGATAFAQETFPINGVRDLRTGVYAFTNATIVQNEKTKIEFSSITSILKFPLMSVFVPLLVPLRLMETPGIG